MVNPITEMLNIRFPVVQGGMQWVGTAELASAVSNGGGLGILTALTQPAPEALAAEISRYRTMTDRPFGVNLTILPSLTPPPYTDSTNTIIGSSVKINETAANNPKEFVGNSRLPA
jgi:NADH:quinone reductase (non-electrogenic)